MKPTRLVLVVALVGSVSSVGSALALSHPGRAEERRMERLTRGHVDKNTELMQREERKDEEMIQDQSGGGGEKYLKREQRDAARQQRELAKLSNQVVKVRKHKNFTIAPTP